MGTKKIALKSFIYCLMTVFIIMSLLTACTTPTTPTAATTPTTTAIPTTTAPTATAAHWWDEFGTPQYGGTITMTKNMFGDNFDPWMPFTAHPYELEQLFLGDMTIDRSEWSYKVGGAAPKYNGLLAKTWEWTDPQTLVVHLREGVHWQNKAPVNGREFTADDVVYHYDRVLGTGNGFTEPEPFRAGFISALAGATAQDKYTVVLHFKEATPLINWWTAVDSFAANVMEPREMVEADAKDWHNAVGTGAFMVTDFVSGTSLTMSRNPDYYLYDERYPENRLPYLDTIKVVSIMDPSTQVAAMRSGQVDYLDEINWQSAQNLQKTNPDLVLTALPYQGFVLEMRNDVKPFNDIRVRKALQMAVDRESIAKNHYGGTVNGQAPGLIAADYGDWAYTYDKWPADLQQEYTYNPTEAQKLLTDAGYPNGFETNIYQPNNTDIELMEIIKSNFKDIGVDLTINLIDQNQMVQFTQTGKIDQMYFAEYANQPHPVNVCLFNVSSMCFQNPTHADTAAYDPIYQQFTQAQDEATAKKLAIQAQEIALRGHWAIHTTPRAVYTAIQPYVKGFKGENISSWSAAWFWTRLWIDQKQKK